VITGGDGRRVTGGCSGIGLGTVELFVAEGASVIAADIQDEKGAMLEKRFPGKRPLRPLRRHLGSRDRNRP
jgi:NAD(P)-dependent dehydrogenase (short-subunit alcohol dehydrogenase family)